MLSLHVTIMKKILTIFKKNEKIKVLPARIELATFALLKYRLLTYKHDALPLCYGSGFCNFDEFDLIFKELISYHVEDLTKKFDYKYKYHMCMGSIYLLHRNINYIY